MFKISGCPTILWLLFFMVGCQPLTPSTSDLTQTGSGSQASAAPSVVQAAPEPPANTQIPTQPFTPTPLQIQLSELPQPYASESANRSPQVVPVPESPTLQVPEGFTVNVFAEGLESPRWLALTPDGDVLVTETRENRIRLLKDINGDGVADQKTPFADASNGLDIPFGMAFAPGYFFLGNTAAVRRYPFAAGQASLQGQGEKIADLPGGGYNQHWTRNVVVAPDQQKLYVSVGSRSNADEEPLPRAAVQVMNLDGSDAQVWASGLRNPVGLDFHPQTDELYATVNERDGLGDDLVPDYLTRIQSGAFFGWPYAYLKPDWLDPRQRSGNQSKRPDLAAQTRTPDVLFQAHSAALGLQFYDGKTFPERYRNGAFVALRGSWNRNEGTGYKLVFVPFGANNRPVGSYEDFLKGFLIDPQGPITWGRPVGLLVLPDGSLLFTEEMNNRIYRVQYTGAVK